jgi:hypothetical protein
MSDAHWEHTTRESPDAYCIAIYENFLDLIILNFIFVFHYKRITDKENCYTVWKCPPMRFGLPIVTLSSTDASFPNIARPLISIVLEFCTQNDWPEILRKIFLYISNIEIF